MKTSALILVSLLGLVATESALAKHRHDRGFVYASVVSVQPVVRYVTVERPRRQCWEETVYEPLPSQTPLRDAAPVIAGGVIGGVIGNQIGERTRQRGALTVLGAAAGSAAARAYATRNGRYDDRQYQAVTVERCEFVHDRVIEERVDGYDVTYRHRGRRYRTRMPHHPGHRLRVHPTRAVLVY